MKLNEITAPTLTPAQVKWLEAMKITEYSVDAEGLVNVDGTVDIPYKNLTSIPVKFGYVGGNFYCHYNNLTSLQGAPREVGGDFRCNHNNLTSLQGGPREVGGKFDCDNNNLSSLQGAPREVGGNFYCWNNKFKTEPDHSFIKIDGDFEWR
jgi:hypothetical protein